MSDKNIDQGIIEEGLPFDIETLIRAVWLRKYVLLFLVAISVATAFVVAKRNGKWFYLAETTLLYQPSTVAVVEPLANMPLVETFLNMVKLRANLEEAERRLKLSMPPDQFGRTIKVSSKRNTTLIIIQCEWDSPQMAADVANTVRDVFLGSLDTIRVSMIAGNPSGQGFTAKVPGLSPDAAVRVMKENIRDDSNYRVNQTFLQEKQLDLDKAEQLKKLGAISQMDYDKAKLAYERQKAMMDSADQIKGLATQVNQLPNAYTSLETGSSINSDPTAPKSDVLLRTISYASPPKVNSRSTRKTIFLGIAFVGIGISFSAILLMVVLDKTIRSRPELRLKLRIPVLGVFTDTKNPLPLQPKYLAEYMGVAGRVRNTIPRRGARILLTSMRSQEGKTIVALKLGISFSQQGEQVLIIDTQVRNGGNKILIDLIPQASRHKEGLGEYLKSNIANAPSLEQFISQTRFPGVHCLPILNPSGVAALLGSPRMRELMEQVASRYPVVLIIAPALQNNRESDRLVQWSDAVIFTVRSRFGEYPKLRRSLELLSINKAPIIGSILTRVHPIFAEL